MRRTPSPSLKRRFPDLKRVNHSPDSLRIYSKEMLEEVPNNDRQWWSEDLRDAIESSVGEAKWEATLIRMESKTDEEEVSCEFYLYLLFL